jgi:hypothetical protein
MPIDDRTTNRSYKLPNAGNFLADDVQRLRDALTAIDADVFARYTKTETDQKLADLINGAPGALDTLNELAAAMGNDPNFAATITNALAGKPGFADVWTRTQADARYVQGVTQTENVFTGTGSQTTFTLTQTPPTRESLLVTVDGVVQPTTAYNLSGSALILSEAPASGASIRVLMLGVAGPVQSASTLSFTQAGTGAVTRTVDSKLKDVVSVKDFGAVGDGATNDTAAIQAAITHAAESGKMVFIPAGTYRVSSVSVTNGIAGILCEGTIKGLGTASDATVVLGSAGNPVRNAAFTLRLNQSAGDLVAVKGYDTSGCSFTDCVISEFVNSPTTNHYAFWMVGPCNQNVFAGNKITLVSSPTQRGFGIALHGTPGTALSYGGFFDGVLSRGQFPSVRNAISANVINGGSYAISLQVAEFNTATGNICNDQNHRSIYVAAAACGNVINSNTLINFVSSAVLLGYNATKNVIAGNRCETLAVSAEAAININTGSSGNLVTGNSIDSPTNYGIYMGCDVRENTVASNDIRNYYLAGIALENDWKSPRPGNALYSRPNYDDPPSPYTAWSRLNSTDNVIQNNVLRNGYTGRATASIAIAQIDGPNTTTTANNIVSGNVVASPDNIAHNLHMYADTNARLSGVTLADNRFHSENTFLNTTTSGATPWNARISYYASNKGLDNILDDEAVVFSNGDTTPSIAINAGPSNNRVYEFSAYTSSTTVTNFTNGYNGQVITLRLHPNVTIAYNTLLIRTKGLANVTGSTNTFIQFRRVSNIWFETWRNS